MKTPSHFTKDEFVYDSTDKSYELGYIDITKSMLPQ